MEIIIMMCLMVIIVLLIQDKIYINKRVTQRNMEKTVPHPPEIMGQSKSTKKRLVSKGTENPKEEQKNILSTQPDFEEEEEEWKKHRIMSDGNSLAQGVTFEELCSVERDLDRDSLAPSQKETTSAILQKIHGTALFNLLENSMEDTAHKIAELLDNSFTVEDKSSFSILRKEDYENFDIGEFI
ncbi:conjugal transfer protein TraD [Chryseobacterium paludis]|uniref:conjugal transfer protein TraD n=1 Tax=Chryseobacterium paludis TaxID=2956784 RepID=UPI0021BE8769|nr:conjugal transfer protein TraD [Chryseobacterium paludis]